MTIMMMTMMLISLLCNCSCEAWIQSTAHLHHKSHNHILISKPHTSQDWFEVATLEVNIFDDRPFPFTLTFSTSTSIMKWISWKLFDRDTTVRRVYQRHVTTAHRMTGMSYAIWVAKYHGTVIGMVTLGVVQRTIETAVETAVEAESSSRRATVGVLCVDPNSRRLGVGALLLQQCIELATQDWSESCLYCHIEESNKNAKQFFLQQGFVPTGETVLVKIQGRHSQMEERPHQVFCREL
jgi:ribosomal protein S18 acetylase RimI-like enzyme